MNYIVVFRRGGILMSLFFAYRDESNVAYKEGTLIRNVDDVIEVMDEYFSPDNSCLLYTSPSPRDGLLSRMPSSA